jgi:hypothetical protein
MTLKKHKKPTLMLLGPYQYLPFRNQVKDELELNGYKAIVMEELPIMKTESALDEKFERIVEDDTPSLFIVFFHKEVSDVDGVMFEIGFISGHYGAINIGDKLAFLGEKGYSWDDASAYIKSSLSKVRASTYDEEDEYYKASQKIHYYYASIAKKNIQKRSNSRKLYWIYALLSRMKLRNQKNGAGIR